MKKYIYLLFTLLVTASAFADKYGPDIIRECPKCDGVVAQMTMMSGNTFGAKFWTDGKMHAPMLPDRPWLVKCPSCSKLFWIDEAKQLGEQESWSKEKKWPDAARPDVPNEEDLLTTLADNQLSEEKELYLRRRAWWAANDAARTNENITIAWTDIQKSNLTAFAKKMDEKNPDQRITKAEILRELGDFDGCIALLSKPFEGGRYNEVASFIRELAEKKERAVQEIKEDK